MEEPKKKKITDEKTALAKAEHYCAYQERSQQEVRDKLYEMGMYPTGVESVISQLIANNFLNEERFARAYAQGKFNLKGWGRIKIKQGLKLKRVSDKLITKALLSIDGDDYIRTLQNILERKNAKMQEPDSFKRRYKLQQYAMSRGFESDLINDVLKTSGLQKS
ncbi:RecX family transcriptional regulator [Mucilaginibacter sp. Bleaf8]|uniref:regulatory protein RecX n=1 Tax=Mucilaginibacter sp. Bleaf8 TaxID=2834430 RepID=UPI001BCDB91A|nr:RecX family transcriptional regulator [Mucilaginibacter sp. Bleaf8]MBS7562862.1 RecX family transcriptional regulator [Mucilaginibacter sp. Bleaf8]